MVSGAPGALTKIGFRRDVRLFFGALVGFLTFLILLLLILLQGFLNHARDTTSANWSNAVQATSNEIMRSNLLAEIGSAQPQLALLIDRYNMAGITVKQRGRTIIVGAPPASAHVETFSRTIQGSTLTFVFDSSQLDNYTTTYRATATISILATIAAALLLGFYLPRITRPIEEMLDAAEQIEKREPGRDEQQYLLETFHKTIATLKAQEADLVRMHDAQKSRADDLERVTAALTRSLASGFLAVDPNGSIVEVNTAAREILHYDGAAGVPIETAFGGNEFSDALRRAVGERVGLTRVEVQLGADREKQIIGLTTVPLIGEQQQFLGVLALFTDLTHIRDLESRVREMQTLADLGEISAGIAHEFRNSLGAILGYLRLARREELPARPLNSIERAENEATQLSSAVDSLLAFARPMKLMTSDVDLLETAIEVAEKIEKPSGVRIECGGEHVVVEADRALLIRAVDNLVRNAVDSTKEKGGGTVRVTVGADPRPIVTVEDDGIGIDPADVPRLLLPFQSEKATGYGLGLPLSRKIALLHGATLTLTGTPGKGATATIEFLAASSARAVQFVTT